MFRLLFWKLNRRTFKFIDAPGDPTDFFFDRNSAMRLHLCGSTLFPYIIIIIRDASLGPLPMCPVLPVIFRHSCPYHLNFSFFGRCTCSDPVNTVDPFCTTVTQYICPKFLLIRYCHLDTLSDCWLDKVEQFEVQLSPHLRFRRKNLASFQLTKITLSSLLLANVWFIQIIRHFHVYNTFARGIFIALHRERVTVFEIIVEKSGFECSFFSEGFTIL